MAQSNCRLRFMPASSGFLKVYLTNKENLFILPKNKRKLHFTQRVNNPRRRFQGHLGNLRETTKTTQRYDAPSFRPKFA
jgi:hypothetical protein